MTEDAQKKPVRKTAPKKVTPAKAPVKAPAKRKVAPKKGPKLIRNLHGVGVHLRIDNPQREKKFRVELKPRGFWGDCATIPVELQESHEYRNGLGSLFEIITETEFRAIEYPPVGYTARIDTPIVVREADTVIGRFKNVDEQIQQNPRRRAQSTRIEVDDSVGMRMADVPGSDLAFHRQMRAAQREQQAQQPQREPETNAELLAAMTRPRVTIERGHRVNG